MEYTKQELIDAYCASKNVTPADLQDIKENLDIRLAKQREKYQDRLDSIPLTALDQMKSDALAYLSAQNAYQTFLDNENISLE
jgi:hypothetical protein